MLIDLCILVMPLPMLWSLQTTKKKEAPDYGCFHLRILVGRIDIICFSQGSINTDLVYMDRVIIVSIGRLVTLAKAGAALEADLTWTTITYLEWVQCEGPVSVNSVCLPNIFSLCRLVHICGLRRVLRGDTTLAAKPYPPTFRVDRQI